MAKSKQRKTSTKKPVKWFFVVVALATVSLAAFVMERMAMARTQARSEDAQSLVRGIAETVAAAVQQGNVLSDDHHSRLPELFADNDRVALRDLENSLAKPGEILRVRLLRPDELALDDKDWPPLSYGALDLLRRGARADTPPPAVVLGESDKPYIALAQRVVSKEGLSGHVLTALDLATVRDAIGAAGIPEGYVVLRQVEQGRPVRTIVEYGSQVQNGAEAPDAVAPTPGTAWEVAYWLPDVDGGDGALAGMLWPLAAVLALGALGFGLFSGRPVKRIPTTASANTGSSRRSAIVLDGGDSGPAAQSDVLPEPPSSMSEQQLNNGEVDAPVEISESIFRAYDVRGVVGETLTVDTVRLIGQAIASEAEARGQQTIVVGRDGRTSGVELTQALAEGILAAGKDVIDVGQVPTPVLYFATYHLNTGSGVMVTGSHNPPEYNGLKIMLGGDTLFGDDIAGLRQRVVTGDLVTGKGSSSELDIMPAYIRRVTEDVPIALGNPFKVVVDCGNGVAGAVAPKLIRALGHDVIELFCEVDGSFPNHHPDPSQPENLEDLIAAIAEHKADIGFAFDGDGDRIGVIDSTGEVLWPDRQMMLYARDVLSRNPGAEIVYDVKCSSRLTDVISQAGGVPVMWKTGHSFIKNKLKETGSPLAGEMSGHIFFKERWYGFDDALYSAARMLEILMNESRPPHQVFAELPDGFSTPEMRVDMREGQHTEFMRKLETGNCFPDGELVTIDGIRVNYADGWGLVRASNTTPSLVLRFEADTEVALERIKSKFRDVLLGLDSTLTLPM